MGGCVIENILSKSFHSLRTYLDEVPVIDSHEHYFNGGTNTKPINVMSLVINQYTKYDLCSVSRESFSNFNSIHNTDDNNFNEAYEFFEKANQKTKFTAYSKATARGLMECWGVEKIDRKSLMSLEGRMLERNNNFYERMLSKYKIRSTIVDTCDAKTIAEFAKNGGKLENYSPDCRFSFSLPSYHIWEQEKIPKLLSDQTGLPVTNLDELMIAFDIHFKACVDAGIVCIKDQSAYNRNLCYDCVPREVAEKLFKRLIKYGDNKLNKEESLLLSNWLMRYYISIAHKYNIPVQFHTGHLSGLFNEITKTNAIQLISLLVDFSDVHFDLFHGNWPFMDEYLFMGKNYPNVSLDLCWVQSIDPIYCIELMKRVIMAVPHCKLIAFGGDTTHIENIIGFLCIARDNVAHALSDLVDAGWISLDEAKQIACDLFFNNPNEIFRLGFEECKWDKII